MARKPSKKAQAASAADRTTTYARAVAEGQISAGRLVRLACQRHLRDLETAAERGLRFDRDKAERAFGFIEGFCHLAAGAHEGKPFLLQPWQAFIIGCLFGWLRSDGFRRFRVAYIEVGKGNGKSPLAAAIGLYMLVADGEERAEVYAAAVHKEQAGVLFRGAVAMVDQSPELRKRIEKSGAQGREWNLAFHETASFFRTQSTENQGKGKSGPLVHCALLDEVHEHSTSAMVDFMRAGTKGRDQALIVEITNSGADRTGPAWADHEYSERVLQALDPDAAGWNDAWFAYVCQLDVCETCRQEGKTQPQEGCENCDDWRDPANWLKANPNLGISISETYLAELIREAAGKPSKAGIVKRLNLCIWTEGVEKWLDIDLWDRCRAEFKADSLAGRRCFAGLDLSETRDLSARVLLFPPRPGIDEPMRALVKFYCPRVALLRRATEDRVPYLDWEQAGYLESTPGEVIDYGFIERDLLEDAERYELVEVGYDPYGSLQIVSNLEAAGLTMAPVRQNFTTLNAPVKSLEVHITKRTIQHDGHPILRWNVQNAAAIEDPQGNRKVVKPSPKARIDGLSALICALQRCELHPSGEGKSVYETRGLVRL